MRPRVRKMVNILLIYLFGKNQKGLNFATLLMLNDTLLGNDFK